MFDNLKADLRHYSRCCCRGKRVWQVLPRILISHPASAAVIWYRFGSAAWRDRIPVLRQLLQVVYLLGMPLVRIYGGVQIQPQTVFGPGLAILQFRLPNEYNTDNKTAPRREPLWMNNPPPARTTESEITGEKHVG